ncbi:LysR family transcriptional regulator, partial [Burkholderia sp. Cy-637]|uniref:helix-turn-helix domain-containing protein n=1 Tax=Burkholderia sp. Cy-637 TaxID=2608327 RepID=UPI001F03622F
SVAGAARRLGLSASAMSRTLTPLREATGDPLLVRAGRQLLLTPHAEAIRSRTRAPLHEALAVLRPAGADLDLASLPRTLTIRTNAGFAERRSGGLVGAALGGGAGAALGGNVSRSNSYDDDYHRGRHGHGRHHRGYRHWD